MRPDRSHNPGLARFFEIAMGKFDVWHESDYPDMLRHQLLTPLLTDLRPPASQIHSLGLTDSMPGGHSLETFGDLLNHPSPSLPLLTLAKDFAKTADSRLECPLPSAVGSALYTSIIAAALVRHGKRISEMNDDELRQGLEWVQCQEWIDAPLRQLATDALLVLNLL